MKPLPKVSPSKFPQLGDAVASIAQPIARIIDRVAGADIQHCKGCAKRRDALNNLTNPRAR